MTACKHASMHTPLWAFSRPYCAGKLNIFRNQRKPERLIYSTSCIEISNGDARIKFTMLGCLLGIPTLKVVPQSELFKPKFIFMGFYFYVSSCSSSKELQRFLKEIPNPDSYQKGYQQISARNQLICPNLVACVVVNLGCYFDNTCGVKISIAPRHLCGEKSI